MSALHENEILVFYLLDGYALDPGLLGHFILIKLWY
jgi:hypothetical protein